MGLGDIGSAIGGGIASLFSDDGSGEAKKRYDELAGKYGGLNPAILADKEQAQQATNDPTSRYGETDALRELQTQYRSGGLDAIGKSQLAQAEGEANRQATARSNSIGEQARAQNMGNSGVTLALQQQAGQQAGQNANQAALGAAAQAQGNRMAALGGAAGVAGQMGAQENAISQYNAGMRQGVQSRNADRSMQAQQGTFNNRMGQLGGQAGAYGAGYGAQQNADDRTRNQWAGIGKGVGAIAEKIGGAP